MPDSNFRDRPDAERLRVIRSQYADANIKTVQTFLDLQFVYRDVQAKYEQVLSDYDLSESRFILLMFLAHAPQGLPVSALAEKLGVTKATTSKLLDRMTTGGFVEKIADSQDKRAVVIRLTPSGRACLSRFLPVNFQTINSLLGRLSADEQGQLDLLLTKMIASPVDEKV
ncbi:MarR family winged helix-turn-helix transcriptional regulator [Lacticaseibacillus yichunensis]|uniref:MarR family winged helix-turn-helix transcriptional regulator n=1 Tax=Lacticaseibacillus yichunensis TaxID=2486015 RepID=A0ABW4CS04_9LACO|nr:MarR family transcriptional regulator [Lacticaseibacillus yichunensis]